MRIFVAGATGVIGVRLVPLLVDAGHTVAGVTRSPEKVDALAGADAPPPPPRVHVDEAARATIPLLEAPPGTSASGSRSTCSWTAWWREPTAGAGPAGEVRCRPAAWQESRVAGRSSEAMTEHQSSRTLVKSAPELWAECSDAGSLARHLGSFGEIRITKLEPETAVAWEGAAACGTVRLEPSGWGTRVTLTVTQAVAERAAAGGEPTAVAEAEPAAVAEPARTAPAPEPPPAESAPEPGIQASVSRPGMLTRLRLALRRRPAVEPASEPGPEPPAPVAEPVEPPGKPSGERALTEALESLGRAHHRPYSRA
jgi:hypothetical protein